MRCAATLIFLAFAFWVPAASAQTISGFGVQAGLTFATLNSDDVENLSYKPGFVGGAFVAVQITPRLTAQPEILYIQKGGTAESGNVSVDLNLSYLEVPVLLKFSLPTGGALRSSLFAGPYVALATSQEAGAGDVSVDFERFTTDYDFGLTAGGSLGFTFAGHAATVGARYDLGLANISEGEDYVSTGTFAVLLGIAF